MGTPRLDPLLLATVRELEVRARRSVREGLGGAWPSAVRGQGIEFAEVREYVVGDDARTLDWNVSARTGRLQVKRFDEEREQTVLFLLDASRSCAQAAGRRPWREAAGEVVATVGLAAAQAGDRIGGLFFSEGIDRVVPARHGMTSVLALVSQWLAHRSARGGTDLDTTLRELLNVRRRPALVVVVTDGHALAPDATLAAVAARHDLVLLALRSVVAARLPERGRFRFEEPERGRRFVADLGDRRVRAALIDQLTRRFDAQQRRARELGVDWIEADADGDLALPLLWWARRRATGAAR